jgi:RimJ/RimL family protein N-acetyltransferase
LRTVRTAVSNFEKPARFYSDLQEHANTDYPKNLSLRPAEASDVDFYFALRNDQSVRTFAFDSSAVDFETHSKWFAEKLNDLNAFMFTVVLETIPVGQVRIDVKGEQGEIGVAVLEQYRGRGIATSAIRKCCLLLFSKVPDLKAVVAHIKQENIASQNAFAKAGFTNRRIVTFRGWDCVEMALSNSIAV